MKRALSLVLVPVLVVVLLLSVIIPAVEMKRVTRLLHDITNVIEPARIISSKLESGLVIEYSALQGYALSGDSALLMRYTALAARQKQQLADLEILAKRLGPDAVVRVAGLRGRIIAWQELNRELLRGRLSGDEFAAAASMQRIRRDGIIDEMDRLPAQLSGAAATRLKAVERHEGQGLFINAILVMVALAAIGVVVSVSRRERRLAAVLSSRMMSETALREAAEALAGAFTIDDVSQQIAQSARDATEAAGTFVEHIGSAHDGTPTLVVRGATGEAASLLNAEQPYAASLTETVMEQDGPSLLADFDTSSLSTAGMLARKSSATIALPIRYVDRPLGALFILGAGHTGFRVEDTRWAHTMAHLAALAYEKVRLLDEAREGRGKLEQMMKSRQRLMRGFSHDVKNPLGAADGYADLLSAGIYGELADEQKETLQRIRRSIRRALDLIDDLHALARTETGNIAVHREPVDVAELARTNVDEYRGAAYAAGLPLTLEVVDDLPMVETDGKRVWQIVGNFLSNAIKYTARGSVMLRVRPYPATALASLADRVDIDVIDTGRGIPAEKQELIFEEFSRLDVKDRPGAGLGLAISKRLAEALGGHIFVRSEENRGSTFTLRLPVQSPVLSGSSQPARESAEHKTHDERACIPSTQ